MISKNIVITKTMGLPIENIIPLNVLIIFIHAFVDKYKHVSSHSHCVTDAVEFSPTKQSIMDKVQ